LLLLCANTYVKLVGLEHNFSLWFESSNDKKFKFKAINDILTVILIIQRFIGFDNVSSMNGAFLTFLILGICAKFFVTYIDYYLNQIILEEALKKEETFVQI
jgi:hypothetical protein